MGKMSERFYGNVAHGDEGEIFWDRILIYFLRVSLGGPLFGVIVGLFSYWWMSYATQKHYESDAIIQLAITVLCAYLSFFLGEGGFEVSGVLACVFAALVLARYAWPIVNSHEALESVWHAFEYFGNTIIFFLTGVIIHRAIVPCVDTRLGFESSCQSHSTTEFGPGHFIWMVAFFCIMLLVRGVMIVLCYPVLKNLGYGTSPKDSAFMVWAGLRGAVGISLAILVVQNGGDERAGQEILFLVSGLAFLTLLVSGTTSGALLRYWGMIGAPAIKRRMIAKVQTRVTANSENEYMRTCLEENHDMIEAINFLSSLRHSTIESRDVQPLNANDSRRRRQAVVFEKKEGDSDSRRRSAEISRYASMDDELLAAVGARTGDHGTEKEPFKIEDLRVIEARVVGVENQAETAILRETFYNIVKKQYVGEGGAGVGGEVGGEKGGEKGGEGGSEPASETRPIPAARGTPPWYLIAGATTPKPSPEHSHSGHRYWEMLENGHLPRHSEASWFLLDSVERSLDHCEEELHDWSFLESIIETKIHGRFQQNLDDFANWADEALPDW